jgi:N-acetylmuramoyl-L-alanine amidase
MSTLALVLCLAGGTDIEELGRKYDFTWTCDPGTGRHVIKADGLTLVVVPGMSLALLNGTPTRLVSPAVIENGRLRLPPDLTDRIKAEAAVKASKGVDPRVVDRTPPPPKAEAALRGFKIAIDPGHGGIHTGYVGRAHLMEKEINLDVSLELREILASWGATVIMTRQSDRHLDTRIDEDLDERVDMVNAARPDLFLSIHTNGVANPEPRGYEVWVPKNATGGRAAASDEIADLIRRELRKVWGSEDRGTKDEKNLRVLNGTRAPAALVELEFVSNPWVERKLNDPAVRRQLAEAIGEAVRSWCLRRIR